MAPPPPPPCPGSHMLRSVLAYSFHSPVFFSGPGRALRNRKFDLTHFHACRQSMRRMRAAWLRQLQQALCRQDARFSASTDAIRLLAIKAWHHRVMMVNDISNLVVQAADKHDWVAYAMSNAPLVGLAGLAAGAHEAFLNFEVRAPHAVSPLLRGSELIPACLHACPLAARHGLPTPHAACAPCDATAPPST